MEITPSSLPWKSIYKILTGSVLPRPIGWISTLNMDGRPNLAPFSFFNVVCANPPTVLFCPMIRSINAEPKDSLNNVRATGEFVVNIFGEELVNEMNATSVEAPPEWNEFEITGLETAPSLTVSPPRVRKAPIHFECKLNQIVEINREPGGGFVVIGTVIHIHVDEKVLQGADKINLSALRPVGRLVGNYYTRVTDLFEMERPKPEIQEREK
ncbi:MAG: flavin reductase family protein [Chloroflexi bacterium]|nr:flavin reductase family protein [Chloroflexota bacterium]MBI3341243.1 flavin reductase family protein [Chloroflexota bacterium]